MVRIRIGTGWREDPAVRLALARGGEAAAEVARRASGALAIEVDGVDVAAGRAEGPVLPTLAALAEGVVRLLGGAARAQIHLPEGAVELLLARRGSSALLTVVSLGRPSRLLAREVEVELPALAAAVGAAAAGLLRDLGDSHPAALRAAAARELSRAAARLGTARLSDPAPRALAAPGPRRLQVRRRRAAPVCAFELRDDQGLLASYRGPEADLGSLLASGVVSLRAPGGDEVLAVEGLPFLLLRDLAALGGRVLAALRAGEARVATTLGLPGRSRSLAVEVDLERGTVAAGDRPPAPAPPLALAEALLEAAVDFCGVVAARNPWQAENGYLAELRRSASQALEHLRELAAGDLPSAPRPGIRRPAAPRHPRRPLGPGRLRRLAWRPGFELEVGPPAAGAGLLPHGDLLVVAGQREVVAVAPGGGVAWRAPGAAWAALDGTRLLTAAGPRLTRLDLATGRPTWTRSLPTPDGRPPRALARLRGGPLLLLAGPRLEALDPGDGASAWRFEPPGATLLTAVGLGALAVVAADTGLIYGLDPRGRIAWRLVAPGPPAGPPLAFGRLCAVAAITPVGGALLAFDPATGHRAWEAPLDFAPIGPPLAFAGRLAVPGAVAGDPVVAAVDPSGAVAWTAAPPLGRGPHAAAAGRLLVICGAQGTCAALDRDGAVRWVQARGPVAPAPPGLPPWLVRGVVVVPGEPVLALDAQGGEVLGQARVPPPERLLVDAALGLTVLAADGLAVHAVLSRRLGVVG